MSCQTAGIFGENDTQPANIGTVQLDVLVRGDTWPGFYNIGPVMVNNARPQHTLASARITFRQAYTDLLAAFALVSGTPGPNQGQLLILDATNWVMQVPPLVLPLPVGTWLWDLEVTDSTGTINTWVMASLQVVPDVSQ